MDLCMWDIFSRTGNIEAYLLYKDYENIIEDTKDTLSSSYVHELNDLKVLEA